MVVSGDKLVAWLTARANSKNALVFAIYSGLIGRIRRGDFDEKEGGKT